MSRGLNTGMRNCESGLQHAHLLATHSYNLVRTIEFADWKTLCWGKIGYVKGFRHSLCPFTRRPVTHSATLWNIFQTFSSGSFKGLTKAVCCDFPFRQVDPNCTVPVMTPMVTRTKFFSCFKSWSVLTMSISGYRFCEAVTPMLPCLPVVFQDCLLNTLS